MAISAPAMVAMHVAPFFVVLDMRWLQVVSRMAWCVFVLIPVIMNEINRFRACVITPAVARPVFGMPEWDVQVYRRPHRRYGRDNERMRINQGRRWVSADVDTSVKVGISDAERSAGAGSAIHSGERGTGEEPESKGVRQGSRSLQHKASPWSCCSGSSSNNAARRHPADMTKMD